MGVIRKLFFLAILLGSAYCWLVLFEYGPSGFVGALPTYYERFVPEEEKPKGAQPPPPLPKRNTQPVIGGGPSK